MKYILRPWHIDDLESLVEHANNFKIAKFLTDGFPNPYTLKNGKAFIEIVTKIEKNHFLAIEVEGKAVGGIGISLQSDVMRKNAELGYWLGEKYWGLGIVTEAIAEIVKMAFNKYDIIRIYARPFGNNFASQKVLEKNGFQLEARIEKNIFKNGEFLDELIYAIRR